MIELVTETGGDQPDTRDRCPRKFIGLSCLATVYPPCICQHVEGCDFEIIEDDGGRPAVVNLTMHGVTQPLAVMDGLNLTGFRASFAKSGRTLTAAFMLRRPENHGLDAASV